MKKSPLEICIMIAIIALIVLMFPLAVSKLDEIKINRRIQQCIENKNCDGIAVELEELVKKDRSLKNFDLEELNLASANLTNSNLRSANLSGVNLSNANLTRADLIAVKTLTPLQIKSACFWEKAYYEGSLNANDEWIFDEQANQQYIDQLKQDTASDPKEPIDCRL